MDGTDITGATIDGTDVTEITVDGQTVFTAGPPVIDDFESGNLNNYTVTEPGFSVTSTNVFDGSFCVEGGNASMITTNNAPGGTQPEFGTDFEYYVRVSSSASAGFAYESSGVRSQGDQYDGYLVRLRTAKSPSVFEIIRGIPGDFDGGGGQVSSNVSLVAGRWYNVQVTFSGSTATYELIDTTNSSSLATISHGSNGGQGTHLGLSCDVGGTVAFDSIQEL